MHGSSGTGGRPTLVAYTRADLQAVGPDVRAGAGRGRRDAGQHRAQRLRLRPVHRRARHPPGRDRARRDRGPGLRRDDVAAGDADQGPAAGHPDLHAVVRDPARRGAGRGRPGRPTACADGRASSAPSRGPTRCGPGSRSCSACARSTSTACPRSSARASPPSASSPPTACTSTRTTSWSRRSTRLTGEPVPDGTPGELVFTTVTKEALPLLRYRTGDIAALRRGTCRVRPHPGQDEQGRPAARTTCWSSGA